MTSEVPSDKELRKIFFDIVEGFSDMETALGECTIKHFNNHDQHALEQHHEDIYNKAKKNGLPTEKESLELLREEDLWSEEEEGKLTELKNYRDNLSSTKKNLIIPSQIESINEDIKKADKDYSDLFVKRQSLLTETCESYAKNKNNDYSIYLCLYKKGDRTEKFLEWDAFCELPKTKLGELFNDYITCSKHLSLSNIKYLAISPMFSSYYNLLGSKNLHDFFKKPVYELTFYQLNLLNYTKVLNSILENVEGIPESIKSNPDDLIDYAESKQKNKNVVEKSKDKQGFSVVGATKKDMDEMGVSDELAVSPFELAKEKGSLTIEDFQNMS
jgi:hypothetical protein